MHEASLAKNIIDSIERRIEQGEITGCVRSVFLSVGRLTAVVPDNLRFIFEILARDSALDGAGLEIEQIPVRARCLNCRAQFEIEDLCFLCTQCNSPDLDIVAGRELRIESVEVE